MTDATAAQPPSHLVFPTSPLSPLTTMFQGLSNFANLMKSARELQGKAGEIKERLKDIRVEGRSAVGEIIVEASGDQRIVSCRVEESLLASGDAEQIAELFVTAANHALDNAKQAAARELQELAGGLDMPALNDTLAKFGLGPAANG